jgi:hypothetical protein
MANNILMIPGKSVCINGWKKEYNGRLASQASSDIIFKAAGQYVCVDHNPTPLEGGSDSKDGKLSYLICKLHMAHLCHTSYSQTHCLHILSHRCMNNNDW